MSEEKVSYDETKNDITSSTDTELGSPNIEEDLTAVENGDLNLSNKISLINDAIDEIGFTWFHFKLFCVAGFGYSVDSQMMIVQSSVKSYVDGQMKGGGYPIATEIFYAGLLTGSIVFGFGADLIGRKLAFNMSLLLSSAFGFFTGGTSSYAMYCIFLFLSTLAAGGNLATDVAVFLEFLPSKYQYLNTSMAAWWGVGQTIANLIAWRFLPSYSCDDPTSPDCTSRLNRGWRYCWYVNSGIVMGAALIRLVYLQLGETPKFLVSTGRDQEAVNELQTIAAKYNRSCSLSIEKLQECGEVGETYFDTEKVSDFKMGLKSIFKSTKSNCKILFSNKLVARSTSLIISSWLLMGVAYAVFYNFLYIYIASHGGDIGSTPYITYRNSTLANFVGIFGPIFGGLLIHIPRVGRRGTMVFGALASMAIFFGYTTVRTPSADAGFGCASYFFVNVYYGCLFAYTPEVFPTKARGTGVALCLVANRIGGSFAPVIYWYGQKSGTSVPIWVCGAVIGSLSLFTLAMPFEPSRQRTV